MHSEERGRGRAALPARPRGLSDPQPGATSRRALRRSRGARPALPLPASRQRYRRWRDSPAPPPAPAAPPGRGAAGTPALLSVEPAAGAVRSGGFLSPPEPPRPAREAPPLRRGRAHPPTRRQSAAPGRHLPPAADPRQRFLAPEPGALDSSPHPPPRGPGAHRPSPATAAAPLRSRRRRRALPAPSRGAPAPPRSPPAAPPLSRSPPIAAARSPETPPPKRPRPAGSGGPPRHAAGGETPLAGSGGGCGQRPLRAPGRARDPHPESRRRIRGCCGSAQRASAFTEQGPAKPNVLDIAAKTSGGCRPVRMHSAALEGSAAPLMRTGLKAVYFGIDRSVSLVAAFVAT